MLIRHRYAGQLRGCPSTRPPEPLPFATRGSFAPWPRGASRVASAAAPASKNLRPAALIGTQPRHAIQSGAPPWTFASFAFSLGAPPPRANLNINAHRGRYGSAKPHADFLPVRYMRIRRRKKMHRQPCSRSVRKRKDFMPDRNGDMLQSGRKRIIFAGLRPNDLRLHIRGGVCAFPSGRPRGGRSGDVVQNPD